MARQAELTDDAGETGEQLEEESRRRRGRRGRAPRAARDASRRRVPAEVANIFERIRGSSAEIELSRYDERDDLPAFLRNVPAGTFTREWVRTVYGGGKFQAIGVDLAGRVVAKADFRIEGRAHYPTDPTAPAAAAASETDTPNKMVTGMMMNMLTMQTAMTKQVVEMLQAKNGAQPAPRDPIDDFIKINTALRAANPQQEQGIGAMAKTMREVAALGAEFAGADKSLAGAVVEAAAPLAEQLAEGIKETLADRRRARALEEQRERSKIAGHIGPTKDDRAGAAAPAEASTSLEGEMGGVKLQDALRDYIKSQLPILARKAQLGVGGIDAGITFFRQLYEITDLNDWPEVQSYARNELVIQSIRSELLNVHVDGAWVEEFLSTIVKEITETRADEDLEEVTAPEQPAPEPPPAKSNGKAKKK